MNPYSENQRTFFWICVVEFGDWWVWMSLTINYANNLHWQPPDTCTIAFWCQPFPMTAKTKKTFSRVHNKPVTVLNKKAFHYDAYRPLFHRTGGDAVGGEGAEVLSNEKLWDGAVRGEVLSRGEMLSITGSDITAPPSPSPRGQTDRQV